MKVKVKGLVFVGFAAAVFATSAMAAPADDAKTVTSKLYVDSKFQTLDNLTTSSETADWTSDTEYPSMKVVATKVGTLDSVAGIQGDSTYTKVTDVTVGSGTSAHTVKQVELQQIPASASTEITGTLDSTTEKKLVTTKAVKGLIDTAAITSSSTDTNVTTPKRVYTYVQDRIKTTSEDTIGSTTGKVNDADVPTMKSVYNFVTSTVGEYQPQAPTTDGTSLYLGHNTQATSGGTTTNTADWKKLEAAVTGTQATTDYVTIKEDSGVYKINIPTAQLTSATTDFTGTVTSGVWGGPTADQKAKLVKAETINSLIDKETTIGTTTITDAAAGNTTVPTSKNVYDFVTSQVGSAAYQPRVGSDSPQVGIRTGAGTDASPYVYTWNTLQAYGGNTATAASTKYVTMTKSGTTYSIGLASGQLATAATGLVNANATSGVVTALTSANKVKLVEAQAVEALVDYETTVGTTTITSANSGNGKVPTVKNVYDFVTAQIATINPGGLTIPRPTGECADYDASGNPNGISSTNNKACALVLVWTGRGIGLEWTPMAQDVQ